MSKPLTLSDIAKKKLPKKAIEHFTQFVTERVFSSLIHASPRKRTKGLHVSNLLPDCMRSSGYKILFGSRMDMRGVYRTGIGTHLHSDIKILEIQELPLEWEGIVTDGIDEYSPELGIWAEKKFTWGPPDWDIWPYNRRQMEYYKNMLVKNDRYASHGFVIYFDLSKPRVYVRYADRIRAIDTLASEMIKKRDVLTECRRTAVLPERKIGRDCFFCGDARNCLREIL